MKGKTWWAFVSKSVVVKMLAIFFLVFVIILAADFLHGEVLLYLRRLMYSIFVEGPWVSFQDPIYYWDTRGNGRVHRKYIKAMWMVTNQFIALILYGVLILSTLNAKACMEEIEVVWSVIYGAIPIFSLLWLFAICELPKFIFLAFTGVFLGLLLYAVILESLDEKR